MVFLGKPYATDDPYFLRFQQLVDGKYVRYPGFVSAEEKYGYLRGARGFALLSQFESGCIAIFEAAAAGLPLFLSDLRWARQSYPEARDVSFVSPNDAGQVRERLLDFYQRAHRKPGTTFPLLNWAQVAQNYLTVYHQILGHEQRRACDKPVKS